MIEQTFNFHTMELEQAASGVLTVRFNVPNRSMNVFDEQVLDELNRLADFLVNSNSIPAVVFISSKESGFFAGADVEKIHSIRTPEEADRIAQMGQHLFNKIAELPLPTVAAIHGPCLGGGLEFALACRYRIARDDARTRLGLPEVELGILPAWGGCQRLPQVVGVAAALSLILEAKKLSANQAEKIGLVDQVISTAQWSAGVADFAEKIVAGKLPTTRRTGVFDWFRDRTRWGQALVFEVARRRLGSRGHHYPALPAVLAVVQEGLRHGHLAGSEAERHHLSQLLFSDTCRNLLNLFFQREKARERTTWAPDLADHEPLPIRRMAVIGSGVMGAGIAQLAAFNGVEVLLKDVKREFLESAMSRIRKLFTGLVRKGLLSETEANLRMNLILPCVEWPEMSNVDLAVEAVTEKEAVKCDVLRELDRRLPSQALIVSNTSALSISHLAEATTRPSQVAGLHFFNPVHKMQLVEIVRHAGTDPQTLARLASLTRKLGKTPIVVQDSPGFLVNRVLFPYLEEGVRLLCEGVPAETIDREARKFGMPMGPLELLDSVGLDVAADVARTLSPLGTEDSVAAGRLRDMVESGWLGVKSGRGFYEYHRGRRGRPSAWHEMPANKFEPNWLKPNDVGLSLIQQRLVLQLINEASRCLGEDVVAEPWIADLGMVMGTGFAPFHGGPLRLADHWGLPRVIQMLDHLRATYGDRFAPAATLRQHRDAGQPFFAPEPSSGMTHAAPMK